MGKIRFTYEAPRSVKLSVFVKQIALYCDLDCKVEVIKGWLTESGTIVCKGTDENVIKFKDKFKLAIYKYNEQGLWLYYRKVN